MRSGLNTAKSEAGLSLRDQMRYAAQSAKFNKLIFEGDENAAILPIGQVISGIMIFPPAVN
jgi:hypothetical protein